MLRNFGMNVRIDDRKRIDILSGSRRFVCNANQRVVAEFEGQIQPLPTSATVSSPESLFTASRSHPEAPRFLKRGEGSPADLLRMAPSTSAPAYNPDSN
jgi:hypothetical protein